MDGSLGLQTGSLNVPDVGDDRPVGSVGVVGI